MEAVADRVSDSRKRPYDLRWGNSTSVKAQFGVSATVLKAAWMRGWVRARQVNWESDGKRTQTVYSFEDLHRWLEDMAHCVTTEYAQKWWTDDKVSQIAEKMAKGPFAQGMAESSRVQSGDADGTRERFYFCFLAEADKQGDKDK